MAMAIALPTYKAAKQQLWQRLQSDGWHMSNPRLKVPWADHPDAHHYEFSTHTVYVCKRVWFKPQSIHVGFTRKLGDARTITYDDIRVLSTDTLVQYINDR